MRMSESRTGRVAGGTPGLPAPPARTVGVRYRREQKPRLPPPARHLTRCNGGIAAIMRHRRPADGSLPGSHRRDVTDRTVDWVIGIILAA
jgi:hypothetical protein